MNLPVETSGAHRSGVVRVMLVDDHALLRMAVRQALTAPDVEVVAEAASAEEALLLAPQVRPDVLLVDIALPGMDGVALVRELAPRLPDTRIVMLSVSGAERDVLDAMRCGAVGYLTKDVAPGALLRAVRSAHAGELAMTRRMAARLVRRLEETSRPAVSARDSDLGRLTPREVEVLRFLADGRTDREIAQALTISPRTVTTHVASILRKLAVTRRADAARRYRPLD